MSVVSVMDADRPAQDTAVMIWWGVVLGVLTLLVVAAAVSDLRNRRRGSKLAAWQGIWLSIREQRRDVRAYEAIKNAQGPGTDWMSHHRR